MSNSTQALVTAIKMNNSNHKGSNGVELTEGTLVFWTNPDRYESDGRYIVDSYVGEGVISLVNTNGSKPDYHLAFPSELKALLN